jgi:hypothetical protein
MLRVLYIKLRFQNDITLNRKYERTHALEIEYTLLLHETTTSEIAYI